jgi:hypothetical protein
MEYIMLTLRNVFLALILLASGSFLVACDNATQKDAEAPAAEMVEGTAAEAGADTADSTISDAEAGADTAGSTMSDADATAE